MYRYCLSITYPCKLCLLSSQPVNTISININDCLDYSTQISNNIRLANY